MNTQINDATINIGKKIYQKLAFKNKFAIVIS